MGSAPGLREGETGMKWHLRPWELSDVPLLRCTRTIRRSPPTCGIFSLSLHAKGRGSIYRRLYGQGMRPCDCAVLSVWTVSGGQYWDFPPGRCLLQTGGDRLLAGSPLLGGRDYEARRSAGCVRCLRSMGYCTYFCGNFRFNTGSQRVLEKNGFQREGFCVKASIKMEN